MSRSSILAVLACLAACPLSAHEWYDEWCCNTQDCAPVPASTVQSVPGGYRIVIEPGQHPLVTRRVEDFVSYDDSTRFRRSQDDLWHVCIYPQDTVRCVYQPGGDG